MAPALKSVAVAKVSGGYPEQFPFDPDTAYPEYRGGQTSSKPNPVYASVRKALQLLGYDRDNFGTPGWNPLGAIIKPGNRVFIKPNLCTHEYGRKNDPRPGDLFSVVTHPSVVRAIADYAAIALSGAGEIVIGDNSTIDTNFAILMGATGLDKLPAVYDERFGTRCTVLDLRDVWCDDLTKYGNKSLMTRLPGDPRGETVVNLGRRSFFHGLNPLLYRGVFTDRWDTIKHHHGETQEYAIANSIYESDVYISVPKLKTHHKVGATLNIKGLVGMCTKKNYLIHWRVGYPTWGGDEYPSPRNPWEHFLLMLKHLATFITPERFSATLTRAFPNSAISRLFQTPRYRGAWEGNDTCWRMAADLYQALMSRQRPCFTVIDGVVGGDGNGPFCTGRREAQTVIASEDLLLADCVAVRLMDFHLDQVRYLGALLERFGQDLNQLRVLSEDFETGDFFASKRPYLNFTPPSNWPGLSTQQTEMK